MNGAAEQLPGRWVARTRTGGEVRLRLLCFPHVGAGPTVFRNWLGHLPGGVELCGIRLPGRENRLAEPLVEDGDTLFEAMEPAITPLLDLPYLVVGHCSGSVLAYQFTRRLIGAGMPAPRLLILSSADSPPRRHIDDPLHLLPRDELLARVVKFGGMPEAVRDDPDLITMYERILRADYCLIERLVYSTGAPLDLPIAVIGGRHDEFVPAASMADWWAETSRDFTLHLLDAGHYVLREAGAVVGRLVRQMAEDGHDSDQ